MLKTTTSSPNVTFAFSLEKSTFVLLKNDNSNHNDFNHFRMVAHSAVLVYKGPSTYKQTNLIIPGKRKGMDHRTSSPVITCLGLNSKTMHIVSRDAIGQCFIPQTHNEGAVRKHHNKDVFWCFFFFRAFVGDDQPQNMKLFRLILASSRGLVPMLLPLSDWMVSATLSHYLYNRAVDGRVSSYLL